MKFSHFEAGQQEEILKDANEINALVDSYLEIDPNLSAQETSDFVAEARKIDDLYKKSFGEGWAEKMMSEAFLKEYSDIIESIDESPRQLNDMERTDRYIRFKNGPALALQITAMGFNMREHSTMTDEMVNKIHKVADQDTALDPMTGKDIPLAIINGKIVELGSAFNEWEANGRKGSPSEYVRKDFPQKAMETMILFLKYKYTRNRNIQNLDAAKKIEALLKQHENHMKKAA